MATTAVGKKEVLPRIPSSISSSSSSPLPHISSLSNTNSTITNNNSSNNSSNGSGGGKGARMADAAMKITNEIQKTKKKEKRERDNSISSGSSSGSGSGSGVGSGNSSNVSVTGSSISSSQRFTSPYKSHTPTSPTRKGSSPPRSLSPPVRTLSSSTVAANLMPVLNLKRMSTPAPLQPITSEQLDVFQEKEKSPTSGVLTGSPSQLIITETRKRRASSGAQNRPNWLVVGAGSNNTASVTLENNTVGAEITVKSIPSFVSASRPDSSHGRPISAGAGIRTAVAKDVALQMGCLDNAISAIDELQNVSTPAKLATSAQELKFLIIGSDKHPLVLALQELNYSVHIIAEFGEASKHLRENMASPDLASSPKPSNQNQPATTHYDAAFILCNFQSIRDVLPVTALNAVKAAVPDLPTIMVLDVCNENQITRLLKEGTREVLHPPFTSQIVSARLSGFFDSLVLKKQLSKLGNSSVTGLTDFKENLAQWEQQCKMRDFQIKVLEEVRTKSESYINMLEEKVKELNNKAEKAAQSSVKMKTMNVALKWKIAGSAAKRQQDQQLLQAGMGRTPLQKLMEIATHLDRNISKDDLKFLLSELNQQGFLNGELASGGDLLTVRESRFELGDVCTLEFSGLDQSEERMINMVVKMFQHLNLLTDFNISETKFHRFLRSLRNNYQHNPYHNFYHACDVTQMVFFVLVATDLPCFLSKLDALSLLVAALCHDVQHPGHTNAFEVNTKTELAMLYNDVSVLENHHCARTFGLMRTADDNFLESLTDLQIKEVRYNIISSILNTDMSHHFELLARFTSIKDKIISTRSPTTSPIPTTPPNNNPNNSNSNSSSHSSHLYGKTPLEKPDRQVLVDMVLHMADISNQVRPWNIAKLWSDKLFAEFLNQGDLEKELGLSVSPHMNRVDADQAKMSLNFIDFICAPLFNTVASTFPQLGVCAENLKKNREKWASLKK